MNKKYKRRNCNKQTSVHIRSESKIREGILNGTGILWRNDLWNRWVLSAERNSERMADGESEESDKVIM